MFLTVILCSYAAASCVPALFFGYLAWQTETWWRAVLVFVLVFVTWPVMVWNSFVA